MSLDEKKLQILDIKLDPDSELRFEIETRNEKVFLTLKSGTAEIYGTELVKCKSYEFTSGAKIAVFTWHGCVLELKGKPDVHYVAKETPMIIYANCHGGLDQMRQTAEKENKRGPICMVVGPADVGKSTVVKILLNYAVRIGRRPLYVDLDLGQGQISIPGTIGAVLVERPSSIDEGFAQEAPLVYNYGSYGFKENLEYFHKLLTQLSTIVKERLEVNKKTKMSGCIINTCGWIKNEGYKIILHEAQVFEVDIIFVLDQERLYNELVRDVPNFVKVVYLAKSGGVVERSKSIRSEARDQRIREYFYGTLKNPLYPHSFDVKWIDIKMFKVGAPALPDSCLPLGMKAEDHLTKLVLLTPNSSMLHHIFSVSFAEREEDILLAHSAGFVCVTNIDADRQTITVLSPQPKPLPNSFLIMSDLQFMDSH